MSRHATFAIAILTATLGWTARDLVQEKDTSKDWSFDSIEELSAKRAASKRTYLPFMNHDTLSCGLYALPKGGTDGQSPHGLDEVYYVVKGKASFTVGKGDGKETRKIKPGSVLFVRRGIEHRFHDMTEDLEVLVFFSKAKVLKK